MAQGQCGEKEAVLQAKDGHYATLQRTTMDGDSPTSALRPLCARRCRVKKVGGGVSSLMRSKEASGSGPGPPPHCPKS
jgi:hypothetical protein